MNQMSRISAIVMASAVLSLIARGEDAKPAPNPSATTAPAAPVAPPASLEAQIQYLEGALAEGMKSKDWKMTELAIQGFKTVGVSGTALELSMLRAEKQAALESIWQQDLRAQIEVWGLLSRAKLSDSNAQTTLRTLANEKVLAAAMPTNNAKGADMQAAYKAYANATAARGKRDAALLALALLKEPEIRPKALEAVRAALQDRTYTSNAAVLAVLAVDAAAGWKALMELSQSAEIPADGQIAFLNMLANITLPPQAFMLQTSFQLETDLAAALPKDATAQLWKPFTAALIAFKPDATGMQNSVYTIPMLADRLQTASANTEGLAALAALRRKFSGPMAQYIQQQIEVVLNKHHYLEDVKGVAPPKAPDTF